MTEPKTEKLIPLQTLLRRLLDSSNISLGEHETINAALNKAAQQAGAQPGGLFVVQTTTPGKKRSDTPTITYDLGFHDTHPENSGELITLKEASSRDWDPTNRRPEAKKGQGEDAKPSMLKSVFTP